VLKTELEAVRRDTETPRRKAILLLAGYRGGSTLTGEVFNRNPNVLYYFEPMALFGEKDVYDEKIKFLNDTFHCGAPTYHKYKEVATKHIDTTEKCEKDAICMWQLTERLCLPPFCWSTSETDVGINCHRNCESPKEAPGKIDLLEKVCQNDVDTVAVKTIRFWNIEKLAPFFSDKYDIDFKAVVLIRDPRSVYNSRKNLYIQLRNGKRELMEKFLVRLEDECKNQIANYDYYRHKYDQLREKVLFVRYEDLALNQSLYIDAITKFTGTPLDSATRKKILKTTSEIEDQKRNDFYTTSRQKNENQILNSWRLETVVDKSELKRIENVCDGMMREFGYIKMRNKMELIKDLSSRSVKPSAFCTL